MSRVSAQCRRVWRRLGVSRTDTQTMVAELEADLGQAASDGVSAESYIGRDPHSFALEWASARGLRRPRSLLFSSALAGMLGAIPGALFAFAAAYGMSSSAFADVFGSPVETGPGAFINQYTPPVWLRLGVWSLGAIFAYLGTLASVSAWLSWRMDETRHLTLRYLAIGLPFGTLVAIFSTIGFAWTEHFSTAHQVVVVDSFVCLAVFSLVVLALRLVAIQREHLLDVPGDLR